MLTIIVWQCLNISKPGSSKSKGFIPAGWYPTCVRVVNHTIFIANGKGFSSLPNPNGPNPAKKSEEVNYQQGDVKKLKRFNILPDYF